MELLYFVLMGMHNIMFLPYVALMGLSFFGLLMVLLTFEVGHYHRSGRYFPGQECQNPPGV